MTSVDKKEDKREQVILVQDYQTEQNDSWFIIQAL